MSDTTVNENEAPNANNGNQPERLVEGASIAPATRPKKFGQTQILRNQGVFVLGGFLVVVLLLYVFVASRPTPRHAVRTTAWTPTSQTDARETAKPSPTADPSIVPVTDAVNPPKPAVDQALAETDIEKTATRVSPDLFPSTAPGSLDGIAAFSQTNVPNTSDGDAAKNAATESSKGNQETPNAPPSLVFTRRALPTPSSVSSDFRPNYGLGLPPGFKLRARLESAATTAVRIPVVAVIEYNYERNGTVIVPAGSKAIGRIEQADRSGYLSIHFESLILPDAAAVPIDAIATDSYMRPLRGKVEGNNSGKQFLVRSLTGVGEIGSLLVGRGSLNQPLSESDMLRERIGQNIAQASDQQLTGLGLTQHLVVSLPANTAVYVVLEQTSRTLDAPQKPGAANAGQQNMEQLRQLLELQRELSAVQDR